MRKLILVPLAAAICMSMSGCPKINISIDRGGDAAQSNQGQLNMDQSFEYDVQDGAMVNGFISGGNGISRDTQPTGESQKPTESTPASTGELVGTWNTVSRSGKYLYPHTIEFNADGTFYEYSSEYTHTSYDPQLFAGFGDSWEPLPMGFPGWYGTYTVSGNTVTMVTLGDDIGSVDSPVTNTLTVDSINGDVAVFNGQQYLKNFTPSNTDTFVEELAAALGVDLSV